MLWGRKGPPWKQIHGDQVAFCPVGGTSHGAAACTLAERQCEDQGSSGLCGPRAFSNLETGPPQSVPSIKRWRIMKREGKLRSEKLTPMSLLHHLLTVWPWAHPFTLLSLRLFIYELTSLFSHGSFKGPVG